MRVKPLYQHERQVNYQSAIRTVLYCDPVSCRQKLGRRWDGDATDAAGAAGVWGAQRQTWACILRQTPRSNPAWRSVFCCSVSIQCLVVILFGGSLGWAYVFSIMHAWSWGLDQIVWDWLHAWISWLVRYPSACLNRWNLWLAYGHQGWFLDLF